MLYSLSMLSDQDLKLLEFEAQAPHNPSQKEEDIWRNFQLSATRYYQRLNVIIENPDALKVDPTLVSRLRRKAGKID